MRQAIDQLLGDCRAGTNRPDVSGTVRADIPSIGNMAQEKLRDNGHKGVCDVQI